LAPTACVLTTWKVPAPSAAARSLSISSATSVIERASAMGARITNSISSSSPKRVIGGACAPPSASRSSAAVIGALNST